MNVRNVDEFLEDIDRWTVDEIERWEDEEGNLKYLEFDLVKPFAEEEVEVPVQAHLVKDTTSFTAKDRNGNVRSFQFGGKDHFLLTLSKSNKSVPATAFRFVQKCLSERKVDEIQELLGKQYRFEVSVI